MSSPLASTRPLLPGQRPSSFGAASASRAAAAFLASAGLPGPLSLLRVGTGVVFTAGNVVVRVADPELGSARPLLELALAPQLAAAGVLAAQPLFAAPYVHAGGVVTAWERVEVVSQVAGAAEVGTIAARLRTLTPSGVGGLDPLSKAELFVSQAARSSSLPAGVVAALVDLTSALRVEWEALSAPPVLVHGDLNTGNVLVRPDGAFVLVDLEDAGFGPAEYEVSPYLLRSLRYGEGDAVLEDFVASYGAVLSDAVLDLVLRVRTLLSAAWYASRHQADPSRFTVEEAALRSRSALDGSLERWTRP